MQDFDDELRRTFREMPARQVAGGGTPEDVDGVLGRVHGRVRRRRRTRAVAGVAASVALLAGGGFVVADGLLPGGQGNPLQTATGPDRSATASGSADSAAPTGGTSADPVPGVADGALSMSAMSSSRLWVLTDPGCGTSRCLEVARTDDAGRTFRAARVAPKQPPVSDAGAQIRFADPQLGWVFLPSSDALWTTEDGGRNWHRMSTPSGQGVDVLEARRQTLYVASGREFYVVPAGGGEWTPTDLGAPMDEITSVAVSDRQIAVLGLDGGRAVLSTSPEAGPWQPQQTPCPASTRDARLASTGDSLWLTCYAEDGQRAFVQQDGTQRWEPVTSAFGTDDVVFGSDERQGVIAGPTSGIALVRPGAEPEPVDAPDVGKPRFTGCTNPTTCYVITEDGKLLRSDQSLEHWAPVEVPTD